MFDASDARVDGLVAAGWPPPLAEACEYRGVFQLAIAGMAQGVIFQFAGATPGPPDWVHLATSPDGLLPRGVWVRLSQVAFVCRLDAIPTVPDERRLRA